MSSYVLPVILDHLRKPVAQIYTHLYQSLINYDYIPQLMLPFLIMPKFWWGRVPGW